jgi:AAA ATPase domain
MPRDTRESAVVSAGADNASASPGRPKGVFYRQGEYWTVGVGEDTVRLRESKGLAYIDYLLRHPAAEFHVLDLAGGIGRREEADPPAHGLARGDDELERAGIHLGGLGDAGEVLDDQAKSAYRRRLAELRQELEEAKALGKVKSAEQLEEEIDALTGELSRAVGLGGRHRRAASASERARQTIAKAIKGVIERVARSDEAIGNIFSRCIKTGTFCSYQPDPEVAIAWEFAAVPAESPVSSLELPPAHGDEKQSAPAIVIGVPFSTARRTPFVGRENESRAIRSAIDRAQAGSGSVIMLAGAPGMGKTRLAIEIAEYAARKRFACLLGRCYERDDPFPYLPFVQIIEEMLAQSPSLDEFSRIVGENPPSWHS